MSHTLWPDLNEAHLREQGCELSEAQLDHQEAQDSFLRQRRARGEHREHEGWEVADIPEVERILERRNEREHT